jgi:glycosyltransferase involved in cell wall biosynthesis
MLNNKLPLLSIIIPTKNRQHTCLFAIESVLLLNKEDVEIIVQDCSDSNILEKQISDKFETDTRISYEYIDTKPSMTDNWNRAFERATGMYKCGIGDDDAVLPNIYDIAKWAKENDIDAVGHSKKYEYFWPDFTVTPGYTAKLIVWHSNIFESVKVYERKDLDELLKIQAAKPNMNYRKLPMVYHCLLANSLTENLIKKTGKFLDGTSLDVYSAFSLGLLANKFYVYDAPFTIPGACGASNSNRSILKSISNHFSEFKIIVSDKRIPKVYNLTFTIAESTQTAFRNLNDITYSKLLDLPYLYADFLSYSFNIKMIKDLYRLMKENKFTAKDYIRLVKNFVRKTLVKFRFIKKILIRYRVKGAVLYKSDNILEAMNILKAEGIL